MGARRSTKDILAWVLLAVVVVLSVRHALFYRDLGVDDAFITFRYAWNLTHGLGPVYNAGEHVEGTSSFLMMLLVALPMTFGAAPLTTAKVIGLTSLSGLVVLALVTVRRIAPHKGRLLGLLAACGVAASTPLAVFSEYGLETTLCAALVAAAVFLLVRPGGNPTRPW
jgi:arabinofuranosyltransferase